MKNIALIICLLFNFSQAKAQYWKTVSSGTHKKLLSVSFGNQSTGYISGVDSLILKTTDGGVTWLPLSYSGIKFSSTLNDIIDINFVDSLIGFATVSNIDYPANTGTIFKTTDAGATWYNISTINMVCSKTFFFDEYNGFQVGSAYFSGLNVSKYTGSVWVMPDWENLNNFSYDPFEFLRAIDFRNNDVGIVGGDKGYVFRTFDAGVTWDTVKTITDTTINELLYLSDSTIVAVTDNASSTMMISKDTGKTWAYDLASLSFDYPRMKAMVLTQNDSIISVGHSTSRGKGLIYDFYLGMGQRITEAAYDLNDVNKSSDSIVFIVGDSGLILTNREIPLSVRNVGNKNSDYKIYPNPTRGKINTEMEELHQVILYDMLGRTVFTNTSFKKQHHLDLTALDLGLYWLVLNTKDNAVIHQKILLQ